MRVASIASSLDPSTVWLEEGEEVLEVGGHLVRDLVENLGRTVSIGLEHLVETVGRDPRRVRVCLSRKSMNVLLLADPADLEAVGFLPCDGEHPGQVGTWDGRPVFLVAGDSPLPWIEHVPPPWDLAAGTAEGPGATN